MYAGDGWAGEKVKGQTQDYTNTVQTERLRETLRKEMVRTSRLLPASAFCSKTLTAAVWLQRVVARGASEAMESLKTLRATNREEHQQMLAARRSPRSSVRPSSPLRSHQLPTASTPQACPSDVLSPAAPCSARPPCRGSDTPPSVAHSARAGTAA